MKNKIFLYALIIVAISLGVLSCKTVDIRTEEVKSTIEREKGLELLAKMQDAHDIENWKNIGTYSCHIVDEFYGLAGKLGNPFPNNVADFELTAIPYTFTSKATFQDGKWEDKVWGIQSWQTYEVNPGESLIKHNKNHKDIEFWLPTYQYFIEAPLRLPEADIVSYGGERTLDGKIYDIVFISWGTDEPQKDIDQYNIWLDRETHMLKMLHYTVRDANGLVNATMKYETYEKNGKRILFPSELKSNLSNPEKTKTFHKITIDNIRFDEVEKEDLLIFPDMGATGKQ